MTVDHSKTASEPQGQCTLKAFACVCVFSVRVQQSPVRYKAVMCLWSTPYHQMLPTDFTDFFCYFYKIKNILLHWHKRNCFDLFYVELQWTKKCTFYFTHSLGQSHSPFARTLNGAWKYVTDWMLFFFPLYFPGHLLLEKSEWFRKRVGGKHLETMSNRETEILRTFYENLGIWVAYSGKPGLRSKKQNLEKNFQMKPPVLLY